MTKQEAAAKLDHPNICAIHEVSEAASRAFIVMQYVESETLAARIQREPMELTESLDIAVQVADALADAHSHQVIQRDIKPQNIMISAKGQCQHLDPFIALLRHLVGAGLVPARPVRSGTGSSKGLVRLQR